MGQSETRLQDVEAAALPRGRSIYDRLEQARARRLEALATPLAANNIPKPVEQEVASKLHLLPHIVAQEIFDPQADKSAPNMALRLGVGILAFSVMAAFTLADWRSDTSVAPPVLIAPQAGDVARTTLPAAVDGSHSTLAPILDEPDQPANPAIPEKAPATVNLELQQSDPVQPVVPEVGAKTDLILEAVQDVLQKPDG